MATTCTDVAAAISARVLNKSTETERGMGGRAVNLTEPSENKNAGESRTGFSPLCLRPQQVRPQDDRNVAGSHFINIAILSQFSQELYQIPATKTQH